MTETRPIALLRGIKTGAVVADGKLHAAVQTPQRNLHRAGPGVAADVAQCLLCDAIEAERNGVRQRLGNLLCLHAHWNGRHPAETFALGFLCLDQATIIVDLWTNRLG